jgi:hypothetical protein
MQSTTLQSEVQSHPDSQLGYEHDDVLMMFTATLPIQMSIGCRWCSGVCPQFHNKQPSACQAQQ